jgi:hypothetical protein
MPRRGDGAKEDAKKRWRGDARAKRCWILLGFVGLRRDDASG